MKRFVCAKVVDWSGEPFDEWFDTKPGKSGMRFKIEGGVLTASFDRKNATIVERVGPVVGERRFMPACVRRKWLK